MKKCSTLSYPFATLRLQLMDRFLKKIPHRKLLYHLIRRVKIELDIVLTELAVPPILHLTADLVSVFQLIDISPNYIYRNTYTLTRTEGNK